MTLIKYSHENETRFVIIDGNKRTSIYKNITDFNFNRLKYVQSSEDLFSAYIRKNVIYKMDFNSKEELINLIPEEFL